MGKPAVRWSNTRVTAVEKTVPPRTSLVKALLNLEDNTAVILDMESAKSPGVNTGLGVQTECQLWKRQVYA